MKKYYLEEEIVLRGKVINKHDEIIVTETSKKEVIVDTDNVLLYIRKAIYNLSMEDFGKLLDLKRQQVFRLENGKTKLTKVHIRALRDVMKEDGHDTEFLNEYL